MNFHIGTATGIGGGGAQPTGPHAGGEQGIIGGAGYCILTSITVVSFGAHLAAFILTGGGQETPTHAGGAAAGITIG